MADVADVHLFCRGCGYDLTGVAEARCPECGREFNAEALREEVVRTHAGLGRSVLGILLIPVLSTLTGMGVGYLGSVEKTGSLALLMGILASLALLLGGILISRKLALSLGVGRALKRGIAPFGGANRGFIWTVGIGLFCCQGFLAAGGFFGGCACILLQHTNFH